MPKKKWESVIGTDTALAIARKILTQFHNGESFDNVSIEQHTIPDYEDDPYCILKVKFSYLNADQLSLMNRIMKDYPKATFTVEDNNIQISSMSDEEKEFEEES